eukprot:5662265-Amphidinium_carterae.1
MPGYEQIFTEMQQVCKEQLTMCGQPRIQKVPSQVLLTAMAVDVGGGKRPVEARARGAFVQEHRKRLLLIYWIVWTRGHFERALPVKRINQGRAGVAVVARQHIGPRPFHLCVEDQHLFAGRLVAAQGRGLVKGGVVICYDNGIA